MEAGNGERVPLVLSDEERITKLIARLDETARRAAETERRIRERGRPQVAPVHNGARPMAISAANAPGFSFRSAPLLAARRLSRL